MASSAPQHVNVTLGSGTDSEQEVSLLEILDHILNSGVVIQGSIVISLAGVDLVYLGLNVVLTSVETALRSLQLEEGSTKLKQLPRKN
jgi:hypothetical protein